MNMTVVIALAMILLIVVAILFIVIYFFLKNKWWMDVLTYIIRPIIHSFAKSNKFLTYMKESTGKVFVRGDAFEGAAIQWVGHKLDPEWNVVPGEPSLSLLNKFLMKYFGVYFYGLYPLVDVMTHCLRWWDLQLQEDGSQKPQFHEFTGDEPADFVLLKEDVYWGKVEEAETKPDERIPVNLEFMVTMKACNLYKVMFVAPINWIENSMTRLTNMMRALVADNLLDDLYTLQGDPEEFWRQVKSYSLVLFLKEEWGVEISKNGIEIRNVDLKPEYQKAISEKAVKKMEADGAKERIQTEWGAIREFGDLGKIIRALEATERSPLSAALQVQAVPGLPQFFQRVFSPEDKLSSDDIKKLLALLKEHRK